MRVLGLKIRGFRGIAQADLLFGKNTVLVGPSGAGKSSIIDALSLVFARNRLVRAPTEHDFFGSTPTAATRVQIVATLGFSESDPRDKPKWFRTDRAVPKWWNATTQRAVPSPQSSDDLLCAQIGFAARFDLEHLEVEQMRYFHDDDSVVDPFVEDAVNLVPTSLLNDIGYYVLPARRTWEAAATFSSELFRRVVADNSGIPGEAILQQRDELRTPTKPLEEVASMQPLLERLNGAPRHASAKPAPVPTPCDWR